MDVLIQQTPWLAELLTGFLALSYKHAIMWLAGSVFIWLAFKNNGRSLPVLSVGVGIILTNIPYSGAVMRIPGEEGILVALYQLGIANEIFLVLLLFAAGLYCDFRPLFRCPALLLAAAAGQAGVFVVAIAAAMAGFDLANSAVIGLAGTADWAVAGYAAARHARAWFGPVLFATIACSLLLPYVQGFLAKYFNGEPEQAGGTENGGQKEASRQAVLFAVLAMLVISLAMPKAASLVGGLMLGNLVKESGCLGKTAASFRQGLGSIAAVLFGFTAGAFMDADKLLSTEAGLILALAASAMLLNVGCGILFVKLYNYFGKKKLNPAVGAYAVPLFWPPGQSGAEAVGVTDFIHGVRSAGQIAAVIAGGIVITLIPALAK